MGKRDRQQQATKPAEEGSHVQQHTIPPPVALGNAKLSSVAPLSSTAATSTASPTSSNHLVLESAGITPLLDAVQAQTNRFVAEVAAAVSSSASSQKQKRAQGKAHKRDEAAQPKQQQEEEQGGEEDDQEELDEFQKARATSAQLVASLDSLVSLLQRYGTLVTPSFGRVHDVLIRAALFRVPTQLSSSASSPSSSALVLLRSCVDRVREAAIEAAAAAALHAGYSATQISAALLENLLIFCEDFRFVPPQQQQHQQDQQPQQHNKASATATATAAAAKDPHLQERLFGDAFAAHVLSHPLFITAATLRAWTAMLLSTAHLFAPELQHKLWLTTIGALDRLVADPWRVLVGGNNKFLLSETEQQQQQGFVMAYVAAFVDLCTAMVEASALAIPQFVVSALTSLVAFYLNTPPILLQQQAKEGRFTSSPSYSSSLVCLLTSTSVRSQLVRLRVALSHVQAPARCVAPFWVASGDHDKALQAVVAPSSAASSSAMAGSAGIAPPGAFSSNGPFAASATGFSSRFGNDLSIPLPQAPTPPMALSVPIHIQQKQQEDQKQEEEPKKDDSVAIQAAVPKVQTTIPQQQVVPEQQQRQEEEKKQPVQWPPKPQPMQVPVVKETKDLGVKPSVNEDEDDDNESIPDIVE